MNNDLISREALKNEVDTWGCNDYDKYDFLEAIDNAPTVDVKDEIAGAYNEGYMCGSREAEKARPQGEWILQTYERFNSGNELYKYDCNKCGHREEHAYSDSKLPNFCPNCGARMKGVMKND